MAAEGPGADRDRRLRDGQPLRVDRQWVDAYIPPHKTTDEARVYITYRDFAPSQIWVNVSKDGGRTFSAPIDVLAALPEAQADSFCNTIPGGVKVVKSGPRAGRVYVAWLAADVATSIATGCNYTQMDTFHSVWIAWSDDEGQSWRATEVFDGGFGHDASALFADLTLDEKGNPYLAFGDNLGKQWDVYVSASFNGAKSFNTARDGRPYRIPAGRGTHFFPAVAAGRPGRVDVAFIATPRRIDTLPYGKPAPGGGTGDRWYLYVAQTLDLRARHTCWRVAKITPDPIHVGDVCTLGIFSVFPDSNRSLLDFIDATVDGRGPLPRGVHPGHQAAHGHLRGEPDLRAAGLSPFQRFCTRLAVTMAAGRVETSELGGATRCRACRSEIQACTSSEDAVSSLRPNDEQQ